MSEVSYFVALKTDFVEEDLLQCLGSKVMQVTANIWLLDLSPFYGYWLKEALKQDRVIPALWRKALNQAFGSEEFDLQIDYKAALASHPWRALLLLFSMEENGQFGFVDGRSNLGHKLLSGLSWASWGKSLEVVSELWETQKLPRFKLSVLRGQLQRFRLAMDRLSIKKPSASKNLKAKALQNRYGKHLSWAWGWTFSNKVEGYFPWKSHNFCPPPVVKRFLDEASFYWEPISHHLVEDLDKICGHLRSQVVTRLDWLLTFEDMTEVLVPLSFRNPHDLMSEQGAHPTVLIHAKNSIESLFKNIIKEGESPNLILSWELTLVESLTLPMLQFDIFGEALEEDSGELTLAKLENQISVPLHRFTLSEDWTPENSFRQWEGEKAEGKTTQENASLKYAALLRPLYLWKKPKPIATLKPEKLTFLESSMNKWWLETQENAHRQYYSETSLEGSRWVFFDGKGGWFEHGIFS
ncbi:MAG: hypothetical protein QNL04_05790 [SAR324 cluster bacterium]|nr:hypothetical protein [SAR324 cluster bacterium]